MAFQRHLLKKKTMEIPDIVLFIFVFTEVSFREEKEKK